MPPGPVAIWGWGWIPDQYGRRSDDEDEDEEQSLLRRGACAGR